MNFHFRDAVKKICPHGSPEFKAFFFGQWKSLFAEVAPRVSFMKFSLSRFRVAVATLDRSSFRKDKVVGYSVLHSR